MMNLQERIETMERISGHIGKVVTVTYVDQLNKQCSIKGILKEVTPYSNVVVTYLERIPEKIQSMDIFQGRKIMKRTIGIPFLGEPSAIMSIVARDGSIIFDNENVHTFYNPYFYPNLDEQGKFRIGVNYEAGKSYANQTRELSFGNR